MARLIPKIPVDEISLKPERDVARALIEQLSSDVLVLHSYPWLRRDQEDRGGAVRLREGETDFIILWPDLGLLVVEVKGGEIRYESHTRRWYRVVRGEERNIQDPFEQADRNLHVIENDLKSALFAGEPLPFAYGFMVIFPDCRFSGDVPPGADPKVVLSGPDLAAIGDRIRGALTAWNRSRSARPIDRALVPKVERVLLPRFDLLPVLFRTLEAQEESLFRLTQQQMELLKFLSDRPRAAIEGVAGSGKTMLARAQAERFALKDMSTLVLCYNKNLAEWLEREVAEEFTDKITAIHFHKLCSTWCRKAGIAFAPRDDVDFWRLEAPELLFDAISLLDDRFDAVVVDEGQDFFPEWWEPIQLLLADAKDSPMYVFYDQAQNLFQAQNLVLPPLGEPFHLPTNCRNTREIAKTCSQILAHPIDTHESAPDGIQTEWIYHAAPDSVLSTLTSMTKTWIRKERITPRQIAILSPYKLRNSSLAQATHLAGVPITEDLDTWRDDEGILYSTIRSFKGLEADIVAIVDVGRPAEDSIFKTADFYVGCSRAKHLLKIFTSSSADEWA